MDLNSYLDAQGLTQGEFARRIGRSQGAVSHWCLQRNRMSAESAVLIERATGGQVRAADLRPDLFAPQDRAA